MLALLKACLAFGYIPVAWRTAKVTFIPKAGRDNYAEAKSFRPICLTPVPLKCLERIIERDIRANALLLFPLHKQQHAYQRGKGVETALHCLIECIEKENQATNFTVGAFIDIEGAFDKTSIVSIRRALLQHGVSEAIVKFVCFMLSNRKVAVQIDNNMITSTVFRGCPQGGVLSPLLWCLVIDSLITMLNSRGCLAVGYADDIAILSCGKMLSSATSRLQSALDVVQHWCSNNELQVNATKCVTVIFSRRHKYESFQPLKLNGTTVRLSSTVKFLGVIIDRKLAWKDHIDTKLKKATALFWQCRRAIGKNWGLSPKVVRWIYLMIVRPTFTHAAFVWWPRIRLKTVQGQLDRLQRIACLGITGAFKSSPTSALEIIAGLLPLSIYVEKVARDCAYRLYHLGFYSARDNAVGHARIWNDMIIENPDHSMPNESILPTWVAKRSFAVQFPERREWQGDALHLIPVDGVACYTDGSLMNGSAGCGIFCPSLDVEVTLSLGVHATVFQAEVFAIRVAVDVFLKMSITKKNIFICSDSQAALKAMLRTEINSGLVLECVEALEELCGSNKVTLLWVPGHSGVSGNEDADELARLGSCHSFIGPEPALGCPRIFGKIMNMCWARRAHSQKWRSQEACTHSKIFLTYPNEKVSAQLMSLDRTSLRIVTGCLTGHFWLNSYLHKVGLSETSLCPSCLEEDETGLHFVAECPAFCTARRDCFGSEFLRDVDCSTLNFFSLLKFIRRTKRFSDSL